MRCRKVTSRCTQFATASVVIMVGEAAVGGVTLIPSHPAAPSAVATDIRITSTVATVPHTERSSAANTTMMMPNMTGTNVCMSRSDISENALFNNTTPVRCRSSAG